jgi:hypothetical protein
MPVTTNRRYGARTSRESPEPSASQRDTRCATTDLAFAPFLGNPVTFGERVGELVPGDARAAAGSAIDTTTCQNRHRSDTSRHQSECMNNLQIRLVGERATVAVLELETLGTEPVVREFGHALGNAGFRVVSSEGMLSDQTLRERIYVSDQRGTPLTPTHVRDILVQVLGVLEPSRSVACRARGRARARARYVT